MRRTSVIIATLSMLAALALPAVAAGPDWPAGGPPAHAHMLVLGNERCVDLAGNQVVPINAHHAHLHRGAAFDAQVLAGHAVIPTSPVTAFDDCADFLGD